MNRTNFYCFIAAVLLTVPVLLLAGNVDPVASTDWLVQNLANPSIVVLDIRSARQYTEGHIPGSVNIPLSLLAPSRDGLLFELPANKDLQNLFGTHGIDRSSTVVVVNRTETDFSRADATRAAWTCMVAGIENVAVLDGGYTKWIRENKAVSKEITVPKSKSFPEIKNRSFVASKAYVLSRLGKSVILDTRVPGDYFGITAEPGHIEGAVNLPAPWAFKSDGTFKNEKDLREMAQGVIGQNRSKEIIAYCEVGGYAATWWFILRQLLGYRNVSVYDGSMEQWIMDPGGPVHRYSWN